MNFTPVWDSVQLMYTKKTFINMSHVLIYILLLFKVTGYQEWVDFTRTSHSFYLEAVCTKVFVKYFVVLLKSQGNLGTSHYVFVYYSHVGFVAVVGF